MNTPSRASELGRLVGTRPAAIAVSLVSWTLPRIGFLKFSEAFALLAAPSALASRSTWRRLGSVYWPFAVAVIFSFAIAVLTVNDARYSAGSVKGLYSSPSLVPLITLLRVLVYFLTLAATTYYFSSATKERAATTLRWAYYISILPGLLQIFRIYSGLYFNLPFERPDVGPFSGVFDAGYLRVMGFEIEPLAYASSLVAVCCLSMHNGRRIPWLGLFVLWHTYSTGAIVGTILALIVTASKRLTRWIVPLYAMVFGLVCWFVYTNYRALNLLVPMGSVNERLGAIYACVAMWLDRPLGVGLGLYGYYFNRYDPSNLFSSDRLDWYPNNDPAMFLAYGGLLLLFGYLYVFHRLLRRSRSYWVLVAAIALLFQSGSGYIFFNPALILVFSLLLAQAEPIRAPEETRQFFSPGPLRIFPFGIRFFVRKEHSSNPSPGET